MKIVFFETIPGEEEKIRPHIPPGHDVSFLTEKLTTETADLAAGAQIISVFVKSELRKPLLSSLPDLALITTRSMGFDHIDVEYAKSRDIKVGNVQTYAAHPVAEFTFALLLAVSRKIYPAVHQLREGADFSQRTLTGFNLFGKTLGVVGTGRIGKNVVAIAKSFGMTILAHDTHPDSTLGVEYVPLTDLVSRADIVTLHAPYLKETHHLINADVFAHFKHGSVLINTARGELVDTHALLAVLRDGTVAGAGLDVLEDERTITEETSMTAANRILIDLPNVIVTPHIAFETTEAIAEIDRITGETIAGFLAGKTDQPYL